ncbi:MAG: FCD domain-containing protein [Actinomycetota bacterium]|nr:FCD domain-containing protein [Actinomycetota bacterium]
MSALNFTPESSPQRGSKPVADDAGRPGRAGRRPARVRTRRSEQLKEQIKTLILERNLSAGDPLPTEWELADELDVGRNSLREALQALQAVGIVEIRHGFGMYVGQMSLGALVDELTFHSRITLQNGRTDLVHLIQIREVLERGLVEQLATNHHDADYSAVAVVLDTMDAEAGSGIIPPAVDRRFHEILYRPLNNPLIGPLLGAFWDVYQQLQGQLADSDETAVETAGHHRDIYQAVIDGSPPAAATAMTAHFAGVHSRLAKHLSTSL